MLRKNKIKKVGIFSVIVMLLVSCGADTAEQKELLGAIDSLVTTTVDIAEVSEEVSDGIIASIPSPLEMTSMFKAVGVKFDADMLSPTDNADNFDSNYKKAINLGIYGADLGYINIYEKTGIAFSYIATVKGLANDLKIGQFFDFETIKRMASNSNNLDSILYISTTGFERMNNYLKEQKRNNLSAIMLFGGWFEGLYLAISIQQSGVAKSEELIERIGEQKIALNDVVLLLEIYKNKPEYAALLEDIKSLKKEFDKVKIVYTYQEPEMKEVDGMLVVVDNSSSEIKIAEENLTAIYNQVVKIRKKIIS